MMIFQLACSHSPTSTFFFSSYSTLRQDVLFQPRLALNLLEFFLREPYSRCLHFLFIMRERGLINIVLIPSTQPPSIEEHVSKLFLEPTTARFTFEVISPFSQEYSLSLLTEVGPI